MAQLNVQQKLAILADAAKYDASCASSGSTKRDSRGGKGIGSTAPGMGICHACAPDGRCISLLKILLTNSCIFDCHYCINHRVPLVAPAGAFADPPAFGRCPRRHRRPFLVRQGGHDRRVARQGAPARRGRRGLGHRPPQLPPPRPRRQGGGICEVHRRSPADRGEAAGNRLNEMAHKRGPAKAGPLDGRSPWGLATLRRSPEHSHGRGANRPVRRPPSGPRRHTFGSTAGSPAPAPPDGNGGGRSAGPSPARHNAARS